MNYGKIKPYLEKKLIKQTVHPDYPELSIFNYTPTCQFERAWDDVTLACRGLILNTDTNQIIARPFKKFFNFEEHEGPLPKGEPTIFEKVDGSLGIEYYYDNKRMVATRGSFSSEQAVWATKFIQKIPINPNQGVTNLFEIVYPDNRIVVDYKGKSFMRYLGSVANSDGTSFWHGEFFEDTASIFPYEIEDLPVLDNEEGYVFWWPDEDFRLKVKFSEYVRLHRLITDYSLKKLILHLEAGGKLDELIDNVPDEFYNQVTEDYKNVKIIFNCIVSNAVVIKTLVEDKTRKEQALYLKDNYPKMMGIVFAWLDGKDIQPLLWKKVKEYYNV